ncbi:MAG: hypothetical protein NPIRA02_28420 [Nitrospirales bacterium]|nr:MAG: hypothetical protein NPIRA02_28420 [Nitrospirales bacterium]
MDIGTTAQVHFPQHRTTTAIGDRDVGQKGSYFRRRPREKKPSTPEKSTKTPNPNKDTRQIIDIRV